MSINILFLRENKYATPQFLRRGGNFLDLLPLSPLLFFYNILLRINAIHDVDFTPDQSLIGCELMVIFGDVNDKQHINYTLKTIKAQNGCPAL